MVEGNDSAAAVALIDHALQKLGNAGLSLDLARDLLEKGQ